MDDTSCKGGDSVEYIKERNYKLLLGDCIKEIKKIESKSVDMIFADPPYKLSNDGITCKSGKMESVNKGNEYLVDLRKTINLI